MLVLIPVGIGLSVEYFCFVLVCAGLVFEPNTQCSGSTPDCAPGSLLVELEGTLWVAWD